MMKISDLVIEHTELWQASAKTYQKIKTSSLSWTDRYDYCIDNENINSKISKNIEIIDQYFDTTISHK